MHSAMALGSHVGLYVGLYMYSTHMCPTELGILQEHPCRMKAVKPYKTL